MRGTSRALKNGAKLLSSQTPVSKAAQKFVSDVQTRGESGRLKEGKLPLGLTHIEKKKGSTVELTRARFNLTG